MATPRVSPKIKMTAGQKDNTGGTRAIKAASNKKDPVLKNSEKT